MVPEHAAEMLIASAAVSAACSHGALAGTVPATDAAASSEPSGPASLRWADVGWRRGCGAAAAGLTNAPLIGFPFKLAKMIFKS